MKSLNHLLLIYNEIQVITISRKSLAIFASVMVTVIIIVVATIFLRLWRLPFFQLEILGFSNSPQHWVGWISTLYIAFATPLYPIIKRKYPLHLNKALSVHVAGNATAILFVSIHFAHQVTRSAANYPDLGTGVVLYATMILLLSSGLMFVSGTGRRLFRYVRFLHPAYAVTFYTVIVMHILHDLIGTMI